MGSLGLVFRGQRLSQQKVNANRSKAISVTPCVKATRSWGSTGNFIHGLLDECPAEQQVPAQHKSVLDGCGHTAEVFLGCFPSCRAPGPKACCSLWCCVSEGSRSGASPQHKGCPQPSALCRRGRVAHGRQPEPQNQLPSSHFHIQMAVMKQGNMMCLSVSERTKPHWWRMLIPSCLSPNSSWVHYSSLWLSKEPDFPLDV